MSRGVRWLGGWPGSPRYSKSKVGAPLLAFFARGGCRRYLCCRSSNPHLQNAVIIEAQRAYLSPAVPVKAAPRPLLLLQHQASLHRIAVHVAQFLQPLAFRPHVEVIKSGLPNVPGLVEFKGPLVCFFAPSSQDLLCKTLLNHLHCLRGISHLRLADQQVKVLWHDDVSQDHEAVFQSRLFQQTQEQVAAPCRTEKAAALITAAGDEVQVSGAVIAL